MDDPQTYLNTSGRLLTAPDGTDWYPMTQRDLSSADATSYLAYRRIELKRPPSPPAQTDPPALPDLKGAKK